MLSGLFVTGTDTGVGKTVVAAALMARLRGEWVGSSRSWHGVRYWKPVQTGIEKDDDTRTVRQLAGCREEEVLDQGVRLRHPLSPHLAARLAGQTLTLDVVAFPISQASDAQSRQVFWIVEGAGGVLVPLNDSALMVDLMARLGLPVVVVSSSGLGTINHTLLTLESLRARGITVAGVVMNGQPNTDNRRAIERYGRVAVLGEMPRLDPLGPDQVAAWAASGLDVERRLLEVLT